MSGSKPTYKELEQRAFELEKEVVGKKKAFDEILKWVDQKTRGFESYKTTADLLELYLDEDWRITNSSNNFLCLTESLVGLRIKGEHVRNFFQEGDFEKIEEYLHRLDEIKNLPYDQGREWELKYKGPSDSEKIGKDWLPYSYSGICQWRIENETFIHQPLKKNEEDCYLMTAKEYGNVDEDVKVIYKTKTSKDKSLIRDLSLVFSGASADVGIHPDLVGYTACLGSKENTEGRIQKEGTNLVLINEVLEADTEYQITVERTGGKLKRELVKLNTGMKGQLLEIIDTDAIYDRQNHIGFTTFSGEAKIYDVEIYSRKSIFEIDQFRIPFNVEVGINDPNIKDNIFKLRIGSQKIEEKNQYMLLFEDITERKQAEKELLRQREEQQIILDSVPALIFYKDKENRFIRINRASADAIGLPKEKIEDESVFNLFPDHAEDYWKDDKEVITTERSLRNIVEPLQTTKGLRWVQTDKIPYRNEKGEIVGIIGFSVDITERREAEEALLRETRINSALAKLSSTLLTLASIEEDSKIVLEYAQQLTGSKFGRACYIDPETGCLVSAAVSKEVRDNLQVGDNNFIVEKFDELCEWVLKNRKPLLSNIQSDDPKCTGTLQDHLPDSRFLSVPAIIGEKLVGQVTLANPNRDFSVQDHDVLERLAALFALAIQKWYAEYELKKSHEQLRDLAAHLQLVREDERSQIAREIHDELGQSLTALHLELLNLRKKLPQNQDSLVEKTNSMLNLIDITNQAVQRISTNLRPGLLDDLGLISAMEWQFEEFQKRTEIKCEIYLDPEITVLDENLSTTVFRIFQEVLTNITRHANASKVFVNFKQDSAILVLKIEDNGKGITESQIKDPKSFGIIGIQERLFPWKGKLEIIGTPQKGTSVTVTIPLTQR